MTDTEVTLYVCPQCGSPGHHYPGSTDEYEHTQFACGSFIDDRGNFEIALSTFGSAEDPCSTYADRVAAFTFPPEEEDDE
jgi:hypothetical protein